MSQKIGYWRRIARPIIAKVLKETAGQHEMEIKRALTDAYPFGVRANHPYQVWLDEIKRQRGLKKPSKKQLSSPSHLPQLFN